MFVQLNNPRNQPQNQGMNFQNQMGQSMQQFQN